MGYLDYSILLDENINHIENFNNIRNTTRISASIRIFFKTVINQASSAVTRLFYELNEAICTYPVLQLGRN